MPDAVDKAITQLKIENLFAVGEPRGCTEQEIADIETRYGIKLPLVYRELLTATR